QCISTQRIIVETPIFDSFLEKFVNGAKRLKVGDPSLSDTDLGPVVNLRAAARIKSLLDDARARGCSIVTAGETEGCVIHPTIVI
ncbi:aldehyde dehydrogenase family protein, partial [Klebsiella pneumoniae]|uniref:aldehyde dehydrogenase family protein n=1 Tax=Klebsiella pneumoniae TaxID=573 RepID=UPI0013D87B37